MALQSLFIRGRKQLIANVLIIQQNKHMKYDYLIVGSGLYELCLLIKQNKQEKSV